MPLIPCVGCRALLPDHHRGVRGPQSPRSAIAMSTGPTVARPVNAARLARAPRSASRNRAFDAFPTAQVGYYRRSVAKLPGAVRARSAPRDGGPAGRGPRRPRPAGPPADRRRPRADRVGRWAHPGRRAHSARYHQRCRGGAAAAQRRARCHSLCRGRALGDRRAPASAARVHGRAVYGRRLRPLATARAADGIRWAHA